MGGAAVKKPKAKGKNRLFCGDNFGTLSPKVVKTWNRSWRMVFYEDRKRSGN